MYEYRCEACGARFERLQWHDSNRGVHCDCGSEEIERIPYSRVAVATTRAQNSACDDGACMPGGCCGGGGCQMN